MSALPAKPLATGGWKPRAFDIAGPIVVLALFIGAWYLMHHWALRTVWDKPEFLIPPPHEVLRESFTNDAYRSRILNGLQWTTIVTFTGLAISIVVGSLLAVAMAQAKWLERAIWPYLVAIQAVPILALVPVIGTIWGYGLMARVFVCVIISLFPVVANTLFGLLSAERGQHDLFTLQGASAWSRLWKLQFPAALPAIFAGYRIAAGLSVVGAVVGELFFIRGDNGLGIAMQWFRGRDSYPAMYGTLIVTVLLGIAVFAFFGWLSNRVIGRWHETTRRSG